MLKFRIRFHQLFFIRSSRCCARSHEWTILVQSTDHNQVRSTKKVTHSSLKPRRSNCRRRVRLITPDKINFIASPSKKMEREKGTARPLRDFWRRKIRWRPTTDRIRKLTSLSIFQTVLECSPMESAVTLHQTWAEEECQPQWVADSPECTHHSKEACSRFLHG